MPACSLTRSGAESQGHHRAELCAHNRAENEVRRQRAAGLAQKVIIPKIQFADATPRECVDYVAQRVEKLTDGKQKVSVVWMVPETSTALVTLSLQNVPATEALRYIAKWPDCRSITIPTP